VPQEVNFDPFFTVSETLRIQAGYFGLALTDARLEEIVQRTRDGAKPQWLLVKRRDEEALPGSDVVAEEPRSVLSGRTLQEVVGGS